MAPGQREGARRGGTPSPLALIFASTALDLMAFGMALPVIPFILKEKLDASPQQQGMIMSVYAALQFFSCPVLGRLSDRVGRVPLLVVSAAAAGCACLGMAHAPSLAWYAAVRWAGGVFKCNLTVGQAYITDITSSEDRSRGMGLLGAAFGIGFILGPGLGGFLSSAYGHTLPLQVGAGLCFANLLLAALILPETAGPRAGPLARPKAAEAGA
eukprot:CAMPEP_0182875380 /NCGR_PEP_ID=MMETSP0034_2-20130328/13504_1 /TAXON_ID=156128 /ORGANISM="Nephroselmis pyriformis, Strain CCMP717" /LENGTH=212 /DNA_ID=CAMNT_0025008115 /DNA_START=82 /DNA_END=716 /DNA_ORIENTATION=+